jgi:hypothetical protein
MPAALHTSDPEHTRKAHDFKGMCAKFSRSLWFRQDAAVCLTTFAGALKRHSPCEVSLLVASRVQHDLARFAVEGNSGFNTGARSKDAVIHVIVSVDDETDFMHTIRFTHDDTAPSTDNPRFCIGALRIDYIARTIEVVHREVGVDDVETRAVCSPDSESPLCESLEQ